MHSNELRSFLLLFFCMLLYQPVRADVAIYGLDSIRVNAWAGLSGDIRGQDVYCALSYRARCWFCSGEPQHYNVAAYTTGPTDSAGRFYLTHESGGATLPVSLEWTNPAVGTFTLSNHHITGFTAPPSSPYAPGATNCSEANAQNTISATVAAADLAAAIAGIYSGTFELDLCRLNNAGNTTECLVPVSFSIEIPDLVQITRLEDMALGRWSGSGGIWQSEDFCVFRNGAGGFAITPSGSNDQNGQFHLSMGTSSIPYRIDVTDGSSWFSLGPGVTLAGSSTGFSGMSTRDCGGQDSHKLRVSLLESDLAAAPPGSYADTITLRVEPE
ncbi:hypothetical protein F6455_00430 [Proteobacteria bacterium 005FR1]|nr:hypothetical protein [Proteobacteria bacterium 005FR1]